MGFMDDLKKLAKPYAEDDDDFDEFDDDVRPSRANRGSTAPAPKASLDDLGLDDSSSSASFGSGRRVPGGNKVVNIHTTAQMQVVLVKPDRFDNVSDIAEHLRSKHAVVLNLEATNKDVARRLVDFLSGCAYALDGKIKKSPSAPTSSRRTTWISWVTSSTSWETTDSICNSNRTGGKRLCSHRRKFRNKPFPRPSSAAMTCSRSMIFSNR